MSYLSVNHQKEINVSLILIFFLLNIFVNDLYSKSLEDQLFRLYLNQLLLSLYCRLTSGSLLKNINYTLNKLPALHGLKKSTSMVTISTPVFYLESVLFLLFGIVDSGS